jgi:putative membrane-bound dehydrogenase-like protein
MKMELKWVPTREGRVPSHQMPVAREGSAFASLRRPLRSGNLESGNWELATPIEGRVPSTGMVGDTPRGGTRPSVGARTLALALAVICGLGLNAAEPQTRVSYSDAYGKTRPQPELTGQDMPRFPAVAATNAAATFRLRPGFHVQLAAAEPEVASPVTIAFDEFGRMYVAEMIDYSERREETPHAGRIRRLEDIDGDGRFETSVIFADNLPWPTALACSQGGIFVGASPDILWLKDTTGDGRADERKVVITGFGSGVARLNVQALLNSFNWGLDNRIHGATGPNGGTEVRAVAGAGAAAVDLRGRDFSFDPRTFEIRPEAGGAQYGLSFDSRGHRFVCSNSDHLQMIAFEPHETVRNPAFALPNPRVSIAADGPAAEVFRLSPDEPWRIVRTRWRISGVVPGMVEGGGRVSGYFTGATGTTIYRGDAYGPEFADNAFIGDAGGNLVHRKVLVPDGVLLSGRRPADEQGVEFLASTDTWFRPVHFQNAPDGCLYVVDMYREVIEHPWSIPEAIKKHIDLDSGNDRGRIWRIAPNGFRQPRRPMPGTQDVVGLVGALASPNGWHRETAARLLFERQDVAAVPHLVQLLRGTGPAVGRWHALYALDGLRALLPDPHLTAALDDPDATVREHAVRLAGKFLAKGGAYPTLVERLVLRTRDSDARVRLHVALAMAHVPAPKRGPVLTDLARRDAGDPWIQAAILNGLVDGPAEVWNTLVAEEGFAGSAVGDAFLRRLAEMIGTRNQPVEVDRVLQVSEARGATGAVWVRSLLEGARRSGATALPGGVARLKPILDSARKAAASSETSEGLRLEAIQLLALTGFEDSGGVLGRLVSGDRERVALAAVSALGRMNSSEVGPLLLGSWKAVGLRVRNEILGVLTARPERARLLLDAVEQRTVLRTEIPAATRQALHGSRDTTVAERSRGLLPPEPTPADLIRQFQPALALQGDAGRGQAIYRERCASCHRAGLEGQALGPDLVTVRTAGKDKLLASILDPNAEVAPQYIGFQVELRDGDTLSAIIANETPSHVTLRMGGGEERTMPRSQVLRMASSGGSLMPEGLASGLTAQSLADLLQFVSAAEAPPLGKP